MLFIKKGSKSIRIGASSRGPRRLQRLSARMGLTRLSTLLNRNDGSTDAVHADEAGLVAEKHDDNDSSAAIGSIDGHDFPAPDDAEKVHVYASQLTDSADNFDPFPELRPDPTVLAIYRHKLSEWLKKLPLVKKWARTTDVNDTPTTETEDFEPNDGIDPDSRARVHMNDIVPHDYDETDGLQTASESPIISEPYNASWLHTVRQPHEASYPHHEIGNAWRFWFSYLYPHPIDVTCIADAFIERLIKRANREVCMVDDDRYTPQVYFVVEFEHIQYLRIYSPEEFEWFVKNTDIEMTFVMKISLQYCPAQT